MIYQLAPADVRKWAKYEYDQTALESGRVGKLVFEVNRGSWHLHPADWRSDETSIAGTSPEGEIISYKTIDFDKVGGKYGMARTLEAALGPQKKNDMRHMKALLAESKKTGWPAHYAGDLTKHDDRELRHRDPDLPFGWILRDAGTHLVMPERGFDNQHERPSYYIKSVQQSFGTENCRFYAWDGTALRQKSPSDWGTWVDAQQRYLQGGKG